MDAIDILGGLLRRKSSGPGKGGDILKDIFKGGSRANPQPHSRPSSTGKEVHPEDIASKARELEDLLNVAQDRNAQRTTGQQSPSYRPNPQADIGPRQDSGPSGLPGPFSDVQPGDRDRQNERALVLVRAMVNAAKSDGQISQAEQQSILEHIDSRSPETIQFLRSEFAKPLDVREFAWSVPKGMEQEVYTMSLIAIDLDTDREARYLTELAHGLRLSDDVRDKIHQRLGAPPLL